MERNESTKKREYWLRDFLRTGLIDVRRGDFWADFLGLTFFGGVLGWTVVGDLMIHYILGK